MTFRGQVVRPAFLSLTPLRELVRRRRQDIENRIGVLAAAIETPHLRDMRQRICVDVSRAFLPVCDSALYARDPRGIPQGVFVDVSDST